jgi:hypothetical protein
MKKSSVWEALVRMGDGRWKNKCQIGKIKNAGNGERGFVRRNLN